MICGEQEKGFVDWSNYRSAQFDLGIKMLER